MIQYLPPPRELSRQLTETKWEAGEQLLRENPLLKEYVVEFEVGRYIYKLVRVDTRMIRVHIRLRR